MRKGVLRVVVCGVVLVLFCEMLFFSCFFFTVDQIGSKRLNPRDVEWERLVAAHTPHWLALLYVQVVYFLDLGSQMVYIGTRTLTRNLSCVLFYSGSNRERAAESSRRGVDPFLFTPSFG